MVGPLVATATAVRMPEEWYRFFWVLLGVAGVNGGVVAWAFRRDVGRSTGREGEEAGEPNEMAAMGAWQEMKRTLRERVVWLLSLFFFFYLGAGITAGGEFGVMCSLTAAHLWGGSSCVGHWSN